MRIQKFSRPGVILMATVVAIITSMVAANATQSITTPNAVFVSFSLAPGANSAAITPATSKSVLVMGCGTLNGDIGVGQVSLQHVPGNFMLWVGLESTTSMASAGITQGFSGAAGAHIVYIDFAHVVDIQVASPDTIRVHNSGAGTETGNVTLVW